MERFTKILDPVVNISISRIVYIQFFFYENNDFCFKSEFKNPVTNMQIHCTAVKQLTLNSSIAQALSLPS